jgi:hypothetical protein
MRPTALLLGLPSESVGIEPCCRGRRRRLQVFYIGKAVGAVCAGAVFIGIHPVRGGAGGLSVLHCQTAATLGPALALPLALTRPLSPLAVGNGAARRAVCGSGLHRNIRRPLPRARWRLCHKLPHLAVKVVVGSEAAVGIFGLGLGVGAQAVLASLVTGSGVDGEVAAPVLNVMDVPPAVTIESWGRGRRRGDGGASAMAAGRDGRRGREFLDRDSAGANAEPRRRSAAARRPELNEFKAVGRQPLRELQILELGLRSAQPVAFAMLVRHFFLQIFLCLRFGCSRKEGD